MTTTKIRNSLIILLVALFLLAIGASIVAVNTVLKATEEADAQYDVEATNEASSVKEDTIYMVLDAETKTAEEAQEGSSEKTVSVSAVIEGGRYKGPGTVVHLQADMTGFDGVEVSLQWQVDKGNGWEDVPGETGDTLTIVINNNLNYNYRVAAIY